MADLYLGFALALLLIVMIGLLRVVLGPTRADRLLAVQLSGTGGVGILLLLGRAWTEPALWDVALAIALLAAVAATAFVSLGWTSEGGEGEDT